MKDGFPSVWFAVAFAVYTALLFIISHITSRKVGTGSFFSGERKAPWPVVAYGMIGASLSGVTFISVPGNVWLQNFYYLPLVLGFVVGYIIIAKVLLPLYYRRNLTSIYSYLKERFGEISHITGTVIFMVSRLLGAAVRIFVVIVVLYTFVPASFVDSTSPVVTILIISIVFLTLLYICTYRGGVKTIIWTDVLQTTFMLLAVGLTIFHICEDMGWSFTGMIRTVTSAVNGNDAAVGAGSPFISCLDFDWSHATNAVKQFVSGIFVTVAMTGLDQSMMQKNLACKDLRAAQKNMYTTSAILVAANFFFLILGALLCVYVSETGGFEALGIARTDELFPAVASRYLGLGAGVFFLIGLISASYPSAGAAMTSLTTSVCVDFLKFDSDGRWSDAGKDYFRKIVHALIALLFLLIIIALYILSNDAVVNLIYKLASYTYGPLLGIFFFGILTERKVKDRLVPLIALCSPLLCIVLNLFLKFTLGFDLGFTLLMINGLFSFVGMGLISYLPSDLSS